MKNYKQLLTKPLPQLRQVFVECDNYTLLVQCLIDQKSEKATIAKDQIKLFGLLAECAQHQLSQQLPTIMIHLLKRIKEFDSISQISNQVAETIGQIVKFSCTNNETLNAILKPIMQHLQLHPQNSLCLTRVVQFLTYSILEQNALSLFSKFISLLNNQNGKVEILEGMAAIILSVEEQSDIFADEVIPYLPQLIQNTQWQVKKMALDILYSLVVLQKNKIQPHSQFKELMYELKSNKIKQIRDSANLILEVLGENVESSNVRENARENTNNHNHINNRDHTRENNREHTREPIRENNREHTREPVRDHTREQVRDHTREQVRDHTREPIKESNKDYIREPIKESLKSSSQPMLNKQQSLQNIPHTPLTPSNHQSYNRLSQTPLQINKATTEDKLHLAIEAITMLSGLLKQKGICDSTEMQQVDCILAKLNERDSYTQPTMKFSQFSDTETFISKEAAEILREFKEKQKSEYLR